MLVSVVAVGLGANLLVPSLLASSKSAPLRGSELSLLASTAYGPVLVVGGGALNDFTAEPRKVASRGRLWSTVQQIVDFCHYLCE